MTGSVTRSRRSPSKRDLLEAVRAVLAHETADARMLAADVRDQLVARHGIDPSVSILEIARAMSAARRVRHPSSVPPHARPGGRR